MIDLVVASKRVRDWLSRFPGANDIVDIGRPHFHEGCWYVPLLINEELIGRVRVSNIGRLCGDYQEERKQILDRIAEEMKRDQTRSNES